MTSQRKIIANRTNALKSTGPRTAQGKAIVARNALKHGLLSQHLVLPGEDHIRFDQFHRHLHAQLAPTCLLEQFLVERIIATAWQLHRLLRIEAEMMTEDLQKKPSPWEMKFLLGSAPQTSSLGSAVARNLAGPDTYGKLRCYESQLERSLYRALHELQHLQYGHPERNRRASHEHRRMGPHGNRRSTRRDHDNQNTPPLEFSCNER